MNIDWKAEVEQRKDQMLERLMELLKIDSSRDVEHAEKDAPLGIPTHLRRWSKMAGFTLGELAMIRVPFWLLT